MMHIVQHQRLADNQESGRIDERGQESGNISCPGEPQPAWPKRPRLSNV